MLRRTSQFIAVTAITTALFATAASATVVSANFSLDAGGTIVGSGTFSFDNDKVNADGDTTLDVGDDVSFDFDLFGLIFDETFDEGFSQFPQVDFTDGSLTAVDVFLIDGENGVDFSGVAFGGEAIIDVFFGELISAAGEPFVFDTSITTEPFDVPAPGALALLGLGLCGLMSRRKRASPAR